MADNDWISATTRKPTQEDADKTNCVLAWHRYSGLMVVGWHQFGWNRFLTHWKPAPDPPPGYEAWEKTDE